MSSSPPKAASPEKSLFTEKEERVLKAAWLCLKSPPEIDLEKLRVAADFNTTKTASNTWGAIKKKLASLAPPAVEGDAGDGTYTFAFFSRLFFALLVGYQLVFCCYFARTASFR
jgi:hypothetical protein